MFSLAAALALLAMQLSAQASGTGSDPLPAPLQAALDQATRPGASGTWHVRIHVRHNGRTMLGRSDRAEGAEPVWQVTSPVADRLDGDQREIWRDLQADRGTLFFVPGALPIDTASIEVVEAGEGLITYGFRPNLEGMAARDAGYLAHLLAEITVTQTPPMVVRLRLYAPEPFRPDLVLRITRFELIQDFGRITDQSAPVAIRLVQQVEGRALLREFVDDVRVSFVHQADKPDDSSGEKLVGWPRG